ncbi:MAG: helix-turn-helix domain-containing protein [Acidimicrobiia bacterium]
MTQRRIPADHAKAADTKLGPRDWKRAERAPERFKELLDVKPRAKARYDAVLEEINARQATLRRLREARALTQTTVAELLEMDQSEVSRLEYRSDMLLSTLKRFVQATGGELHMVVQYPDSAPIELLVGDD